MITSSRGKEPFAPSVPVTLCATRSQFATHPMMLVAATCPSGARRPNRNAKDSTRMTHSHRRSSFTELVWLRPTNRPAAGMPTLPSVRIKYQRRSRPMEHMLSVPSAQNPTLGSSDFGSGPLSPSYSVCNHTSGIAWVAGDHVLQRSITTCRRHHQQQYETMTSRPVT